MNELRNYATFSIDLLGAPKQINHVFSIGRARIFYKGINRNRSIIDGDVANGLAATIPGTPVIGTYNYDTNDFEGHEENPSAFGFIPLDPNPKWVIVKDDMGIDREYLEVDVVIWDGRFEEAKDILTGEKSLSMELNPSTLKGSFEEMDQKMYYRVAYAEFAGITVLGTDVEPCFKDAKFLNAYSQMVSAYALYVESANIQEGGKDKMDDNKLEEQVEMPEVATELEEVPTEIVEETAVEEAIEEPAETEEPVAAETVEEENTAEEKVEEVETVEIAEEQVEFESKEDEEEVCPECGKNPCVCENACNKEKYEALEAELADYKAKYESLETKYNDALNSLNEYSRKEKIEIINKFSTKLENGELIEKLITNADSYSINDIKDELGRALVEQQMANCEDDGAQEESNFSLNVAVEDNNLGNSAWDLVKLYKNK